MAPLELVSNYLNDNGQGMRSLLTWFLNQKGSEKRLHKYISKIRYGEIPLNKSQFREFPFETELFGKYARVEKVLENSISESYLQVVSTRKTSDIVSHLGMDQFSTSSGPQISKEFDEHVPKFLNRLIKSKSPSFFADVSYFKVREGIRYVNKALLVTTGVREGR
ncbi:MAG: transposase [Promethearchaeota archaeon]